MLQTCEVGTPGMAGRTGTQCGLLSVYENRAANAGRQIRIAFVRIPALSRTPQPDPVFLLAGGPGQAAIETFLPVLANFEQIRQDRDLILVDQRGTGNSNALGCAQAGSQGDLLNGTAGEAQTAAALRACLARIPGDPREYTTAATIQDLDDVRRVLGYGRVNLVAVSYGTRVALAYLNAYPDRVRSLVLDGVAPLGWVLGPGVPASAQRALDSIFARCEIDLACRAAFPDLPAEFQSLLSDLERQPVEVSLPDPVSGETIRLAWTRQKLAAAVQALSYSQETVALLPLLIHIAYTEKSYAMLAAQYTIASRGQDRAVAQGLYLSVVCAEDVPFFPDPPSSAAPASYLPDGSAALKTACSVWPHADPVPLPKPVRSDVPALLLSGQADPITPPENAAQAAQSLPNSLQVVAPGMGHNVIFSGCLPRVAADFIRRGAVRGLDTNCIQDIHPLPFFLNFSGPKP